MASVSRPATLTQPDATPQPQETYEGLISGSTAPESLSYWQDSSSTTHSWLQAQMHEDDYSQHLHDSLQSEEQQGHMLYEQPLSDGTSENSGADTE